MKKILAIVLSALLLMTVCASLSASAEGGLVVSVAKAEAAAGEDVAVDFVVDSNSGFWGVSLDVTYDTSVLTLKSVEFGSAFSSAVGFLPVEAGAETFTINGAANSLTENCTATGVLATATFTVAADAAEGTTGAIEVTFNENNQIDVDMNNVATTVNNGAVTVVAPTEPSSDVPSEDPSSDEPSQESSEPVIEDSSDEASVAPADDETSSDTPVAPATGSALPIAAIVLAAGSAAVLTFARKK